jgi:thiol-disulfide isomerase/thioredoxin
MQKAVLVVLLAASCASSTPAVEEGKLSSVPVSLRVDRIDGGVLTLGSLRGKNVLITIFTTWADYALLEVPRMKYVASRYDPKDFVVVGIALDDDKRMVTIFASTFEIPYYVGMVADRAAFTSANGPFGEIALIPTSILLDREGRIVARMDGVWPEGVLEAAVDRLVAGATGSH